MEEVRSLEPDSQIPDGRIRVMLVDDHEMMRDGLREALLRAGDYEVVGEAGDGVEAVRAAQSLRPDVIIMDVLMPLQNGIDACREIMEVLPETRVLMVTAATERDAVIEAVAAGATGYLEKYSGMAKLLRTVRDVAEGEHRIPGDVIRRVFAGFRTGGAATSPRVEPADRAGAGDTHPVCAGTVLRCDR